MKNLIKLFTLLTITLSTSVFAEVVVIVHPSNNDTLDAGTISRLYLGKAKSFPGGQSAVPINQEESSAVTDEFNTKVLSKSGSQLKAYWSKLVFTGKGTPPNAVANDAEVIKLVAANPNFIGYVDASAVDSSVKSVGSF